MSPGRLLKLKSQIKIGDSSVVAETDACHTSSECCYWIAQGRLAVVGESSESKRALIDLETGKTTLEDCKFSEETIFHSARYGDVEIYFSWDKALYVRPDLKNAIELKFNFQRQYLESCVNYNRNVRQIDDRVYFVQEPSTLCSFSFLDPNLVLAEPKVCHTKVDTFAIARGRLYTLSEQGLLCKYNLESGRLIRQVDLQDPKDKCYFTCIEAVGENYLIVCSLESNYTKACQNRVSLFDRDFRRFDQTVLKSVNIKKRKRLLNQPREKFMQILST